jgi:hypothetical protein
MIVCKIQQAHERTYRINTGTAFMCSLYFTHNHWYSCYKIRYQQSNILPFPCLYGMFFHVRVVFYTQSLVLMLQYHISTTKHLSVPVFILYVLLCACCILHTIISTNVTISHINNQTFYCSLVYTVCSFMCFTHKRTYRINKGTVECLVVNMWYCNICTSDCVYNTKTHKRTYRINKGTVECLIVNMWYCNISTNDCV